MNKGFTRTTGPRSPTSRSADESARCSGSSRPIRQRFVSIHSATYSTFNVQRHLVSRRTLRTFRTQAMADWQAAAAAA